MDDRRFESLLGALLGAGLFGAGTYAMHGKWDRVGAMLKKINPVKIIDALWHAKNAVEKAQLPAGAPTP